MLPAEIANLASSHVAWIAYSECGIVRVVVATHGLRRAWAKRIPPVDGVSVHVVLSKVLGAQVADTCHLRNPTGGPVMRCKIWTRAERGEFAHECGQWPD